jgi:SAM-dependent methyltransferase
MGVLRGPISELYDVFVDWPGRLGRELPGLRAHLAKSGAKRVLDVGCGTGRHVQALLDEGLDAHGADVSDEMLAQAHVLVGDPLRLHRWRLGDPVPPAISVLGPFDALISLGNVWPQLTREGDVARALESAHALLRPGGLLLLSLKAFAPRTERGDPYLPLLRREHEGEPLYFVRFLDLAAPPPPDPSDAGARLAGFHMAILSGEAIPEGARDAIHQRAGMVRVWSRRELEAAVAGGGFSPVRITAGMTGPPADDQTEDVVVRATRSSARTRSA